jgi:hypothetical protein
MPVSIVEDGQERLVSMKAAFNCLPPDADDLDFANRLWRGESVQLVTVDGKNATFTRVPSWETPQPELFEPPVSRDMPMWTAELTVWVPLDIKCHCPAFSADAAGKQVEDTLMGRAIPHPQFVVDIDGDDVEALVNRLSYLGAPHELNPCQVLIHKVEEQRLLEDTSNE